VLKLCSKAITSSG